MNIKNEKTIIFFFCLVVLFFPYFIVKAITPFGSATTPDSIHYLDTADHIKRGHGAVTTNENIDSEEAYYPERTWPPFYPLLISVFSSHTPGVKDTARLSAILLSITCFLVFFILRKSVSFPLALISGIAFPMTVPVITVFTYAWSETLFMALLAFCTWASIQFVNHSDSGAKIKFIFLGLVTLSLLSLFFTRYAGICLFPLIGFLFVIDKHRKKMWSFFGFWIFFYCAILILFLWNNYNLTGSITGSDRPPSETSFWENLLNMGDGAAVSISAASRLEITTALFSVAFLITVLIFKREKERSFAQKDRKSLLGAIWFTASLYYISILIMRTSVYFDPLGMRFFAPGFPLVWILIISYIDNSIKNKTFSAGISFICIWAGLSLLFSGYQCFLSVKKKWHVIGSPVLMDKGKMVYANFTLSDEHNILKKKIWEIVGPDSVLLTERPKILQFRTEVECKMWPHPITKEKIRSINTMDSKPLVFLTKNDSIRQFHQFCRENRCKYQLISRNNLHFIKTPILLENDE
ncbi:MAG: hypothetical protein ACTSRA_05285 [Promethearchaeota archaeon]